jgi:Fe-S cluster assembly ATPase SufC
MLAIENLTGVVANNPETPILNNLNLHFPEGEINVLFGSNRSGKTILIQTLMGFSQYKIQNDSIQFNDQKDSRIEKVYPLEHLD